jgi:undecaprenyl-diphosphatase
MDIINAIILGIIQGLTEFLPVSSSGHLEIAKAVLGEGKVAGESLLMTVVLHFATALSTIIIFRKDLAVIFGGLFQFKNNESFQFSLKIALSMIPAALVGVLFNKEVEALFGGPLTLVGGMLLITGVILFLADKAKASSKKVGIKEAILIGISQAIAILPGISRSGATISTAVILGIDKEKAARFSFLMVVPLIFGKMVKDVLSGNIQYENATFLPLLIGFIFAFITGLIACKWMIKLVKNSQLKYFAYYCLAIGSIVITSTLI